jgi:hypothetical protein
LLERRVEELKFGFLEILGRLGLALDLVALEFDISRVSCRIRGVSTLRFASVHGTIKPGDCRTAAFKLRAM